MDSFTSLKPFQCPPTHPFFPPNPDYLTVFDLLKLLLHIVQCQEEKEEENPKSESVLNTVGK